MTTIKNSIPALLVTCALGLISATSAFAVANVTAGSASASADTAANGLAPGYTTVSTITIAESANNTFSQNNTAYTLTFRAPAGWTFDLGGAAPAVAKNGGSSDIAVGPTINRVNSTNIAVGFTTDGAQGALDSLTITGIRVQPISGAGSVSANITITSSGTVNGGFSTTNVAILTKTAAAAQQLAFGVQPADAFIGRVITPAVTVQVVDRYGNLTTNNATVILAIGTNPGGGALSGTRTNATVSGTATFSDLSIDGVGTGYKLTATALGLAGTNSAAFNILSLDPDLPQPPTNIVTIAAGSYVIPMDNTNQSLDGTPFNLRAYGLVNQLLQNKIPVQWAIRAGKTKDAADFIASASLIYPSNSAPSSVFFAGGPFIVDASYTGLAHQIITNFGKSVAVYKLATNTPMDIRYTIGFKPSLAVNTINSSIHTDLFDYVGITNYTVFADYGLLSNSCYTCYFEPHNTSTNGVASVKAYVQAGGNFLAECHSIDTYENEDHFQSTSNVVIDNINNTLSYSNADLAYCQFVGVLNAAPGGSLQDWTLGGGSFINNGSVDLDSQPGGNVPPPHYAATSSKVFSGPGGMVFYIGGHNFGAGGTDITMINGQRMLLNAAFVPNSRPTCGFHFVADVGVGKSGAQYVLSTSNLDYTISVTNFGPAIASNVVVSDVLPTNGVLVSVGNGGTYQGGIVSWSLSALGIGAITNLGVTLQAPRDGLLTNSASVVSSTLDLVLGNNTSLPLVTSVQPVGTPLADMAIALSGPAGVPATSNLDYTISVTNLGPDIANQVVVTDTLPLGVTFVSASGNGVYNGGVVTWNLGTWTSGQVSNLTVTVTAPANGSLTNVASVGNSTLDPFPDNNVTPPMTTDVIPVADVAIGQSGPASVVALTYVNYTISVTNFGPSAASSVVVTDTLPLGVTFVSASGNGGINNGVVTWDLGILGSGQVSNLTLIVTAPANGTLTNTASVGSPAGDPDGANNAAPPVVTVVTPVADLAVGKTGPAGVVFGNTFDYTISVTNFGPSTASGISVTDSLPAGLVFVSSVPSGATYAGNQVIWSNLGDLVSGATANLTLTVNSTGRGLATNIVSIGSPALDPNPANNHGLPVVTLVTNLPATLNGLVSDTVTGLPIAGATVQVTDSSNVVHTATSDATGHYDMTLSSGPATLTASQTGYASATSLLTANPGPNTQDEVLTANTLAGSVTNTVSGLPIAGATVVVVDSANVTNTATTDAGGHYSLSVIAAGAATITASLTGYATATATPAIVIGANTLSLGLTATTLTGHVTDAGTHQPIAGATVVVVDSAGTTNTVATDVNGYYSVTNIATGAATTTVSQISYNIAITTTTIVPGLNTQDFQLTASTPTLALLSSIKAFVAGNGVLVRWQTASEVGSVSFDLYRQAAAAGEWIKVNADPVLAANSTAGSSYEVADAGAKPFTVLLYRLVELEERGTTQVYGPFKLRAEAPAPVSEPSAVTEQASAKSMKAVTRVSVIQPAAQVAASLPLSALDGSRFVKITTTNGGIQSVTAAALAGLLGQAQGDIQAAIAAGSLRLSNRGQPVGYLPNSDGSALSFYSELLKNNYTAQNVYWLTTASAVPLGSVDGQVQGLKAQSLAGLGAGASYQAKLDFEQDLLAVPTLVQDPNQDYWMWQRLVAGLSAFDNAGLSFTVDHLAVGGSAGAQLTVTLLGGSEATHTVQVTLNGTVLGQDTWQGRAPHTTVLPIGGSLLVEGPNSLTFKALPNGTATTSQWYLNGFRVSYSRQYWAGGSRLEFTANSNKVITVDGFANSVINVLDVTDPKMPAVVQHLTIAPTAAGYSATFAPANPQGRFVAFLTSATARAASLSLGQVAGWSSGANAADYLIITPDSLADTATTLAGYRQQKGLRAAVVRLDQIYNEFSYGIPTPDAIKQLLAAAVNQWSVKPRYAVLIGNGTYDYRDLLQKHDNLMPPLLVRTSYGLFCSDSAYSDVNGDGLPAIAIGRLPVQTSDQLLALIDKIKTYEAQPATARARSLLVADVPGSAGNFGDDIQQVGATLAGSYSNNVIQCASQSDLGKLRQAIQTGLNTGVDLVNYVGHGAVDRFGNAGYLTSADVPTLQNGSRLPLVVAVTCVAGQYAVPGSSCLAENLLLQGQGGAIAVVAPTGLSVNQDASRLNLRLMQLLRANAQAGIGDLFRQALADHVAQDHPTTQPAIYNLIGDPATTYNVALQASSVIAAPRLTAATLSDGVLVITWSGGNPPYQLEKRSALQSGALWEALGAPVTGTSATVPMTGPAGFIRVRSGN